MGIRSARRPMAADDPAMLRNRSGWFGLGFAFGFAMAISIAALLFLILLASLIEHAPGTAVAGEVAP